FAATDDRHGRELWATDGTPEGTWMVEDRVPGFGSGDPIGVWEVNGRLLALYRNSPGATEPTLRVYYEPSPMVTTQEVTQRSAYGAVLRGEVNPDALAGKVV